MIITVGGSIGSGKSTLAKSLAQKYGLEYHSIGQLMRSLANEKGISLQELSTLAEKDTSIDKELDKKQKELACHECVMDSRLGAYILKTDFSIWLDASNDEKISRVSERDGVSLEEAKKSIEKREASEAKRYKDIYGIDVNDKSVFDLILDTTELTKEEMFEKCTHAIEKSKK